MVEYLARADYGRGGALVSLREEVRAVAGGVGADERRTVLHESPHEARIWDGGAQRHLVEWMARISHARVVCLRQEAKQEALQAAQGIHAGVLKREKLPQRLRPVLPAQERRH